MALIGTRVTLDGSNSSAANNKTLSYRWTLTSTPYGSMAALSSATDPTPTFTADVAGTYAAKLVVSDGTTDSAPAFAKVTAVAASTAPVADAGTNQLVANGAVVTLDGSGSSDPGNLALTYTWLLLSKPPGSAATLSSAIVAKPTFTADVPGTYVASLVVTVGTAKSATVSVAVTSNATPVAVAGADQAVKKGAVVILDGSASTDANNDTLTYRWELLKRPFDSVTVLSSSTAAKPSFTADVSGDYAITLVVNDGTIDSDMVMVMVKVTATAN